MEAEAEVVGFNLVFDPCVWLVSSYEQAFSSKPNKVANSIIATESKKPKEANELLPTLWLWLPL